MENVGRLGQTARASFRLNFSNLVTDSHLQSPAETVGEKPAYREAFMPCRCIAAPDIFEWTGKEGEKAARPQT